MTVSGIAQVVRSSFVRSLSSFAGPGGKPYLLWATANAHNNVRHLYWRPHDGAEGSEVESHLAGPWSQVSGVIRSDGALLIAYTDGDARVANIYAAALSLTTGEVLMAPVFVAKGTSPSITRLEGVAAGRHTLVYARRDEGAIYVGETVDDGITWDVGRAVLNNQVAATESVGIVGFNQEHFSIVQAAQDARPLAEIGCLTRSRPVSAIAASATSGRFYVLESSQRGTELADYLRGAICTRDADNVEVATRARLGVDDGVGDLALVETATGVPTVVLSRVVPAGTTPGSGLVTFDRATLTAGPAREGLFPGTTAATVDLDCIAGFLYVAGYTDAAFQGGLAVVREADGAVATPFTTGRVHAVALADVRALAIPGSLVQDSLLATAYESPAGQYRLALGRVGSAQGDMMAPRWNLAVHKLPGRVNALAVTMDGFSSGWVYAALTDRVNVYRVTDLAKPLRLLDSVPVLTRGRVMQIVPLPNGNLLCAMGEAGVAVLTPGGETLGQVVPSTLAVPFWTKKTWALNDLARPTAESNYAAQRRYFKCTTGGASGPVEPPWGPTGTVVDGAARWTEVGDIQPVVTGVAVDNTRKRIVAVGVLGGVTGASGRVWVFDAAGLV